MTEERFLIVRLSSLGDVVHTLPAVAALRAAHPQARIDWVIEGRWRPVLEGNPDINHAIALDTVGFRRAPLSSAGPDFLGALRELRATGYTCAIDFQGLFKSALVAAWTGAARRVGFSDQFLREPACAAFYTETVAPPARSHVIAQNLALVARLEARLGGVENWRFPLPQSREAEQYVAEQLARNEIKQFIVLNPGGGWLGKCWPPERYGMLSDELVRLFGMRAVVSYGPGEEALVESVRRAAKGDAPVAFPTDLPQLIALLRRARLFIGGDSGPLQLAAALRVPIVGLYGPTLPERNGPFSPEDIVLRHDEACRETRWREPQYTACMESITAAEVVAAAKERVGRVRHG